MEQNHKQRFYWIGVSLVVSILLCTMKFTAWYLTSSRAVLTDALESIINVVATSFALYSVYLSSKPRDENHPYGHGKIEFFSAGFEGSMILIAGAFILIGAVQHLFSPREVQSLNMGIGLVLLSTLGNLALGAALVKQGRKLDSLTLYADGKHLLSDSYSSGLLIAGLLVMRYTGWYLLDSILSILLASVIIFNGYKLVRKSLSGLMDEAHQATLEKIRDILNEQRGDLWIDVHNLRVQRYGNNLHIDCHLTMPRSLSFEQVHDEINEFERLFQHSFEGRVEVFVHADPSDHRPDKNREWLLEDIITDKRFG